MVNEYEQQVEPERLAGRGAVGGQSPQTSSARALPQVIILILIIIIIRIIIRIIIIIIITLTTR